MKIVTIVSGGMDSVTLLHKLVREGHEVEALSFDYGQRHKKELEFAKQNATELGVRHEVVDLRSITKFISNSALTGDIDVPEGHYEDETMKLTVVPNRNMIMLSVAVGYAENKEFDAVAIANHSGDHAIYPDCRSEFISAMNVASWMGTYNNIKVLSPFSDIDKTEIAKIGKKLGVDYTKTWSCYKGGDEHCGKCGTCVERDEALRGAEL